MFFFAWCKFFKHENSIHFFSLFIVLFLLNGKLISQVNYNFFISNSGNNANTGTSEFSPKKTIQGTLPFLKNFANANGTVSIGLKGGDIFNETLSPSYPLEISSYYDSQNKKDFAVLNGSNEFNTGWKKAEGTINTYVQTITYSDITGVGNYSYNYVIEINKALEKTAPFTARRVLELAPSLSAVDTIPGSFYEPVSTDNPSPVYVHSTDNASPNQHPKYRYEIAVRGSSVFGRNNNNDRFENIVVRGYGGGYGLIQGGDNAYYNKIIFGPGAAIHHTVLKSGTIANSLFLPAAKNSNFFAVVFYNVEGFGKHNKINNSIFLDVAFPIYSHNSNGSNYAAVDLDNVIAFADTSNAGDFMSTANNDTVRLNHVYVDKYAVAYYNRTPKYCTVNNSYFKDVGIGIYFFPTEVKALVNNVFIKAVSNSSIGINLGAKTFLSLHNSIIHIKNSTGTFIKAAGSTTNQIKASGNIFICEVDTSELATVAAVNTDNGIATTSDTWSNNVYVLLKGNKIVWNATNRNTNGGSHIIQSFDDWKKQSGQDKNSLYFDLRNDRRGLKAIFIDPDNGDYELANTNEGKQVQALRAGMTDPITCFLKKPTYEEAAELIKNDKILSINSCKNPCIRNNIRSDSKFNTTILNNQQIKLNWKADEPESIDHFEIERAIQSSNYKKIGSVNVAADSLYLFIDNNIFINVSYHYRLVLVSNTGYRCYSEIKSDTTFAKRYIVNINPNPSSGKINVSVHPYTGMATFIIVNSTGQPILIKRLNIEDGKSQQLELANLPKGIYWIKVETIDGPLIQKFILL